MFFITLHYLGLRPNFWSQTKVLDFSLSKR